MSCFPWPSLPTPSEPCWGLGCDCAQPAKRRPSKPHALCVPLKWRHCLPPTERSPPNATSGVGLREPALAIFSLQPRPKAGSRWTAFQQYHTIIFLPPAFHRCRSPTGWICCWRTLIAEWRGKKDHPPQASPTYLGLKSWHFPRLPSQRPRAQQVLLAEQTLAASHCVRHRQHSFRCEWRLLWRKCSPRWPSDSD